MPYIEIKQGLGGVRYSYKFLDDRSQLHETIDGQKATISIVNTKTAEQMIVEKGNEISHPKTMIPDPKSRMFPRRIITHIDQLTAQDLEWGYLDSRNPATGGQHSSTMYEALKHLFNQSRETLGLPPEQISFKEKVLGFVSALIEVPYLFAKS